MKIIIIPDLHNRVEWIEPTLAKLDYDRVIMLGDTFDSFFDTSSDIEKAAEWLKQSVHRPNRIHLFGTHDLWYRFPYNYNLLASGNSREKEVIINSILDKEDWNALKLVHYEQGYLFSHAGVHENLINEYVNRHSVDVIDVIKQVIIPATNEALSYAKDGDSHPWLSAGYSRGGIQSVGGIVWLDWIEEFKPVTGLNQIVGHTQMKKPDKKHGKYSFNFNLDTGSKYIGILEDKQLTFRGVKHESR